MEKWELDTLEAINRIRTSNNAKPLEWCFGLENNIRGSAGGKQFLPIPLKGKRVKINCKHWTPPGEIARLVCKNKQVLSNTYKSGALIIRNDKHKSHVTMGLGLAEVISWDNLCNNYPEVPKFIAYTPTYTPQEYNIPCPRCGGNFSMSSMPAGNSYCRCPFCGANIHYDAAMGGFVDIGSVR
jgi:hypothetical protein